MVCTGFHQWSQNGVVIQGWSWNKFLDHLATRSHRPSQTKLVRGDCFWAVSRMPQISQRRRKSSNYINSNSLVVAMGQAIGLPCPVEGAKAFTNRKFSFHAYQDPPSYSCLTHLVCFSTRCYLSLQYPVKPLQVYWPHMASMERVGHWM